MDAASRCAAYGALTSVAELDGAEGEWLYSSCLWARGEPVAAPNPRSARPDPESRPRPVVSPPRSAKFGRRIQGRSGP